MPTHARARSIVHECTIYPRAVASPLLSSPPPASLSPRLAHARSGRYSARAHVALAVVCQSHARVLARARPRDDVESCQRWHIAAARACTTAHGTIYMFTTNQRPVFPSTVVCLSVCTRPTASETRHRALWSFTAGRDSIESPPRPAPPRPQGATRDDWDDWDGHARGVGRDGDDGRVVVSLVVDARARERVARNLRSRAIAIERDARGARGDGETRGEGDSYPRSTRTHGDFNDYLRENHWADPDFVDPMMIDTRLTSVGETQALELREVARGVGSGAGIDRLESVAKGASHGGVGLRRGGGG